MDFKDLLRELKSRFNVDSFKEISGKKRHGVKEDPFWVDAFHQVYVESHSHGRDDLLFFVKWDDKQNCELVEVFRKDAISLPSARDESVLWEQTLYLNFILHEFEYYVTCGVITVKSAVIDSVKVKMEQKVYPSPSQRRMDKKDSISDVVYPNVMFCVDNFEEVFSDIYSTAPGEKVAVQLIASNKTVSLDQLTFLGAIDYTTLKDAYEHKDQKPASFGSKLKRLSIKSRNSRVYDLTFPYHFIRMRGPNSKGFAEVAVRKHDLSVTDLQTYTPTSQSVSTASNHFFGTSRATPSGNGIVTKDQSTINGNSSNGRNDQNLTSNDSGNWVNVSRDKTGAASLRTCDNNGGAVGSPNNQAEDCIDTDTGGVIIDREVPSDNGTPVESKDTGGGMKAKLKAFGRFPRKSKQSESDPSDSLRMYAYLTYVQLPWYTLVDDILNNSKKRAM